MKKIIVAGAGHGGLSLAAHLAEKGYDVQIFERQKREDLGYDWHDTMSNKTFEYAGITEYKAEDIQLRKQSTFYSPSLKSNIGFDIPDADQEWMVDRKVLYDYLIENALDKGAKIFFEKNVQSALIAEDKVVGLKVNGEQILADLVVDSAGMYSSVIRSLPSSYKMTTNFGKNDIFHTYRGYFNLIEDAEKTNPERFNVYFKVFGIKGIAWYKITDGMADVLVGSTEPLSMDRVDEALNEFRKVQPSIGTELLRGGQIKDIPLKSTLSKLIGDNYAAVGDVVSMPIPLNGSGITNSIRAGQLLAQTIMDIDARQQNYTEQNLWDYQTKYFLDTGAQMISIAITKNQLLNYEPSEIDFLFDNKIITAKELEDGAYGREVVMTPKEVFEKIKKGYKKLGVLLKLKLTVDRANKAKEKALSIPQVYDKQIVEEWMKSIEKFIKN